MIKKLIISLALVITGSVATAAILPSQVGAKASTCDGTFLTFRPWYYGLTEADCSIKAVGANGMTLETFVLMVIMNLVDMLVQLIAYVTVGYIIYGGFIYLTSAGSPDKATRGRQIVTHALIGLVIAIASVGLVRLVGGAIL